MLSVAFLIDCPKSVPQLLCSWTLKCSRIHVFKLNINAMRYSSCLVTLLFHLKYLISFFYTIHFHISANCKTISACSCPRFHNCCRELEGWDPGNRFNHTSWVAIVTPTDRPKSVWNRCVIEVFGCFFMLSRCFLDFSVGVGAFVIGLSQISSFFSFEWCDIINSYNYAISTIFEIRNRTLSSTTSSITRYTWI